MKCLILAAFLTFATFYKLYQLSSIPHKKFIQHPKGEAQSEKSPFALKSP